jgi:RNA polymerase sigma-70 factor (ECF subfamily)
MKNASRADGAAEEFARVFAAARGAASPELRDTLRALWARVRNERGGLGVGPGDFARHVAGLVADPSDLATLHASDVYFALGCALGDPPAVKAFHDELVPRARAAASKTSSDPEALCAVEDVLVQKLLVSDGVEPPRIRGYAGRGPLASWVCAAAVRAAVDHTRAEQARAARPQLDLQVAAEDPELKLIRERHGRDFSEAFEGAFAKLEAADRNVLRLSVVEGLSIDRLAVMFGAHRSTMARRLARIRQYLMEETRNILAERLSLAEPELASLMRAVRSHLQLSLTRLFSAARGPDGR